MSGRVNSPIYLICHVSYTNSQEHVLLSRRPHRILWIKTWRWCAVLSQNYDSHVFCLGRHHTSSMETSYVFFLATTDFHWVELFPFMKLKQWCGLENVTVDIRVRSKWVIFQFRVNYPFKFSKHLHNTLRAKWIQTNPSIKRISKHPNSVLSRETVSILGFPLLTF